MIKKKNCGFTLVEILVALVISVISMGAIFSSYQYFSKTHKLVSQKAALSQTARDALTIIARDLRNAGYQDIGYLNIRVGGWQADHRWLGIDVRDRYPARGRGNLSNSDMLTIYYTVSPTDRRRIFYRPWKYKNSDDLYLAKEEGNNMITGGPNFKVINDNSNMLAPYITDFQVVLKKIDGSEIDNEVLKHNSYAGLALQKEVHTAEVYLTLRSPEEVYKENKTIRITNHTQPDGTDMTITDKYYRETFFISVHTRNLSIPASVASAKGSTTSINIGTSYNP